MRTALTPDGVKIDRKLMGPGERMACKLTPDEDVEYGLHVSEGVETALAGMMLGFAPAWALGSSGGILNFPVLGGIDYLTIVVDNDEVNPKTGKRPGPHAAAECSERWAAAGREVFHIVPDNVGSDIADVVKGATS
jgi:putative DNA primase/helicase